MGRPAQFDQQSFTDAVGAAVASGVPLTIQSVARFSGASVGSIYHRFGSKEALLGEAWFDAVAQFQRPFLADLTKAHTVEDGLAAVNALLDWTHANLSVAQLLSLCRQSEFLNDDTPDDIRDRAGRINDGLFEALAGYCDRAGVMPAAARMALVSIPHAAIRQSLPDAPTRETVQYAIAAARAILAHPSAGRPDGTK